MIMNEKSVDQKMSICHSGVHPINSDFFYFQILFKNSFSKEGSGKLHGKMLLLRNLLKLGK